MTTTSSKFQKINLFAGLSFAALQKIEDIAWSVSCTDGQVILVEGEKEAPVFFVLEGVVRALQASSEGREQTLVHLQSGAAFNIPAAFLQSGKTSITAIAVGETRLLAIAPQDFRRVVSETPEIATAVLQDLSEKLHHFTQITHDLSLRSVRGRLARFLLLQSQEAHPPNISWTHEEIAAKIGTVREVVSRTLRAFTKEKLIKVERQRIIVIDRDALEAEAET